jgi:hypothetical protein
MLQKQLYKLFLVACGFESHDLAEKLNWVSAQLLSLSELCVIDYFLALL